MTATDQPTPVVDQDAPDEVAMTLDAIDFRAHMTRAWAAKLDQSWTVRQHLKGDVPALIAEVGRLRGELAMWRDDVSAQWHAECIRLQGEVERLTRKQLNADIAAGSQPEAGAR